MSMSDFHPELWNPVWSVSSILCGIQSFMNSDELTAGGLHNSSSQRIQYARASFDFNKRSQILRELFGENPILKLSEAAELYHQNCAKYAKRISTNQPVTDSKDPSCAENKIVASAEESNTSVDSSSNQTEVTSDVKLSKSAKRRLREKKKKQQLQSDDNQGEMDGEERDESVGEAEDTGKPMQTIPTVGSNPMNDESGGGGGTPIKMKSFSDKAVEGVCVVPLPPIVPPPPMIITMTDLSNNKEDKGVDGEGHNRTVSVMCFIS
jgi:hypothetical protein